MSEKIVLFTDQCLRDGAQSLWSMFSTYGVHEAVAEHLDNAGYHYIELPVNAVNFKMTVRFFKENPWKSARLFKEKITKTKKQLSIMDCLDLLGGPEPRSVIRMFAQMTARTTGAHRYKYMANTRNELDRHYPWVVPIARDLCLEFAPCICYYPSPRTTDDYYAELTKRLIA